MVKRKFGVLEAGKRALETVETELQSIDGPANQVRTPNGNRQRGGRSGWASRRNRTKAGGSAE